MDQPPTGSQPPAGNQPDWQSPPPPAGWQSPPAQGPASAGPPPAGWQSPPPEVGPAPGVRFADHGARLLSYIVDVIILSVVIGVIAIVFTAIIVGAATSDADAAAVLTGILLLATILVVSLAYFPYFWLRGGQTPGMRLFGLYVVRDRDGGPIDTSQAILRLVGYWINGIVLYIGYAWILVDQRRRGWHDLIAGTVVVQR